MKLVIDNYPEGQTEELEIPNNLENPELGSRKVPFGRELYIEREDFMEEPPKKYFRMFPGNEVRLMGAYYVKCTGCEKDADGNVTVVHGTYDPETKSGTGAQVRKVKGTIHWVAASAAKEVECRLYENIVDEEKGKLNEDGSLNLNPNSLTVLPHCYVEPALAEAKAYDSFQFMRNGYFCADCRDSKPGAPVFNRIVSLKSSFKLPGGGEVRPRTCVENILCDRNSLLHIRGGGSFFFLNIVFGHLKEILFCPADAGTFEKNLDKSIQLADVARHIGVSEPYLSSFFKKTMNENFIPYVNRQKMKRAKQLFAEGKMVYQVSDILGYENSTYFSKVFKKVEGITPEQYRKNLQS